ncbi:MAG: hypothetical protein QW112_01885 [Candidatus Micrarchaeia archaeon]
MDIVKSPRQTRVPKGESSKCEELSDSTESSRESKSYLESFKRILPKLERISTSDIDKAIRELRRKYGIDSDSKREARPGLLDNMKGVYKVEAVVKLFCLKEKMKKCKKYEDVLIDEFITSCSTDSIREMFFWIRNAKVNRKCASQPS